MSCFGCHKKSRPKTAASRDGGGDTRRSFDDVYEMGKLLGEGAFSKVKEATNRELKHVYAVKIVNKRSLTPDDAKGLQQEISILNEIDHPNIIKLHDIFTEPYKIYLVTEIMSGGELFDRIVLKEFYNEMEARDVCRTLFSALDYCHNKSVAHRDLKPENLLLASRDDDQMIKIADFGFAKKCKSTHCLLTQCGTPGYVAPEILSGIPYGTQSDMWSIGVIMYILLAGYPPFNGKNQKELFRLIRKGKYEFHEQFWGDISDDAKDLVSKLLTVDPNSRYTPQQALDSAWMHDDREMLSRRNLNFSLVQFRKFNAKRKLRQAVLATIATGKMANFVGMGNETTFGFSQFQGTIVGCEPMSVKNLTIQEEE